MLVVIERRRRATWQERAQLRGVHLLDAGQLNTYDVLVSDDVVFTGPDALAGTAAWAASPTRRSACRGEAAGKPRPSKNGAQASRPSDTEDEAA